jgi:hypothetical protein
MIANQPEMITLTLTHDRANISNNNRRLSQQITDIVTSPSRTRSGSSPRSPSPTEIQQGANKLSIEFDGNQIVIIRPNRIIRGTVKLSLSKPLLASQIRIKVDTLDKCVNIAIYSFWFSSGERKWRRLK